MNRLLLIKSGLILLNTHSTAQSTKDYFYPLDSLNEEKTYVYFDVAGKSERDLQYSIRYEDGLLYNVVYDDWDTVNIVVESVNEKGTRLEFINMYFRDTLGYLLEKKELKFNRGGYKFVPLSKVHKMNYRQKLRYDNVTYKTKQKFHYKRDDDQVICHKWVTVVYRLGLFRREKEKSFVVLGYGKDVGLVMFHKEGSENWWVLKEIK